MFLGIDLGTSGVKALLMDDEQTILATGHSETEVRRPHPLWSEQDPADWITACEDSIAQIRNAAPEAWAKLQGIGVSGQMHGATLLGADDKPLRPCILWNDGRASHECDELEARADFRGIGGNIVMAGFTAPKLAWIARHEPEVFEATKKILLPKDYVGLWLTGQHVSEMSDASGTLWLDVKARAWSHELLAATGLGIDQMPRLVEGCEEAGTLRPELAAAWGVEQVKVAGGAGDNAATACGLGIVSPGTGMMSVGTSGVLFAANDRFSPNTKGAVHAFCHAVPDTWHQMGVILSASDSMSWLFEISGRSVSELVALVPDPPKRPSEVLFLPYLSGERTPHDAPEATAMFSGLRRGHDIADLTHAVMDGVAFAFADCARVLRDADTSISEVCLAGGGTKSESWLSVIAAATGLRLLKPASGENGAARGAARLAMIASTGCDPKDVLLKPEIAQEIVAQKDLAEAYAERYEYYRSTSAKSVGGP